jgi:thiamine biosynthesis lipoprotein
VKEKNMFGQRKDRKGLDRRAFLKCSGMLGLGVALGGLIPVSECVAFNRKLWKVTRTRLSMGTFCAITVLHRSRAEADDVIGQAFEEMERVGRLLNRYESDSFVAVINDEGLLSRPPRAVSDVIARSLYFTEVSGGAFNITVKPLVDLFKAHFKTHKTPPSEAQVARVLDLVDASGVQFDGRTIRLTREGMGITLDGIAKGYVIDCGARLMKAHGIQHALINAGGDIRAIGGRKSNIPWKVAVQDPRKTGPYVDILPMMDGAIATSGNYEVYFDQEKLYHHIVDPKTGHSPVESTSVTVMTQNAMDADALSTSVFVLGPREGRRFIEAMADTECLILDSNDQEVMSHGWPSA